MLIASASPMRKLAREVGSPSWASVIAANRCKIFLFWFFFHRRRKSLGMFLPDHKSIAESAESQDIIKCWCLTYMSTQNDQRQSRS